MGDVDFGVVNFARVSGMVFNDYLNDGKRQLDADGMPGIKVTLASANASRGSMCSPHSEAEQSAHSGAEQTRSRAAKNSVGRDTQR